MKVQKDTTNKCCRVKDRGHEGRIAQMIKDNTFGGCDMALLKAAKRGDTDAQIELAFHYFMEDEYGKALHWLKLAEKKGGLKALSELANLSLLGSGLRNAGNPVEWYNKLLEQATEEGNEYYRQEALEHLGHCYKRGVGCKQDLDKALEYYMRGAEENALLCSEAAGDLLFKKGRYDEALPYLLKEDTLSSLGYFQLGEIYEHGLGGTEVDLHQAKICYTRVRHREPDTVLGRDAAAKLRQAKFAQVRLKPSEDPDYVCLFDNVYSCTEEDAKRYPLTAEAFLRYFTTDFAYDFSRFFNVDCDYGSPKYKLKCMNCYDRPGNGRDRVVMRFPNHAIFFTVGLWYTSLLPQAVGMVCGEKAMFHAYKASGAPLILSGLHGLSSPILVLSDAGLLADTDTPECQQLFVLVQPVMRQLLFSFLKDRRTTMYPESLKALQREAAPRADEIWQVCEQHLADLRNYLADCQVGYPMKLYDESKGWIWN